MGLQTELGWALGVRAGSRKPQRACLRAGIKPTLCCTLRWYQPPSSNRSASHRLLQFLGIAFKSSCCFASGGGASMQRSQWGLQYQHWAGAAPWMVCLAVVGWVFGNSSQLQGVLSKIKQYLQKVDCWENGLGLLFCKDYWEVGTDGTTSQIQGYIFL